MMKTTARVDSRGLVKLAQIRQAAKKIGRELKPRKVILFGSYAYGRPHRDSDVDFFIIMPSRQRPAARATAVSRVLHPRLFSIDILVRTPQEVRHRLALGDNFIEEIVNRGKVLYEA